MACGGLTIAVTGLHNAHHRSTGTPWWALPQLHAKLYGQSLAACPQVLTWWQLRHTWVANRLRRVLEEDYGQVHKAGGLSPDRVKLFVGSLGVSFLTV
jgi:fatty acid desaturase